MSKKDHWAIVIGVNKYWSEFANLNFAVKDALDITQWLIDENGGQVPPENVFLLTRLFDDPARLLDKFSDGSSIPSEIRQSGAALTDLNNAIRKLDDESNGGERFFFYFTGHGLKKEVQYSYPQDVLLLSGFNINESLNCATVESIQNYFKALNFPQQFFIFDACRSIVPSQELKKRDFKPQDILPPTFRPTNLPPLQHALFGAAPLSMATEPAATTLSLKEENSAMTQTLLRGLKGEGDAKKYVPGEPPKYQVTACNLFRYVNEKVENRKIEVAHGIFQSPRYSLDNHASMEPVLAEISLESVEQIRLNIDVVPQSIWPHAAVLVRNEDSNYDEDVEPVRETPMILPPKVLPMFYTIRAFAPGYRARISPRFVGDFYSSENITVEFIPDPSINGLPPWRTMKDDLPAGELVVKSLDPLAPLEIRNISGDLLAFGQGSVSLPDPEKGFYRAGISLSGDNTTEKIIELEDKDQEILIDGTLPVGLEIFNDIVSRTNLKPLEINNSLRLPRSDNTIGAGGFSSALMLPSLSLDGTKWNEDVEEMGLLSLASSNKRMMVIIADEGLTPAAETMPTTDDLLSLKLSLNRYDSGNTAPVFLEGKRLTNGIAQFTADDVAEGNYVLSIDRDDQNLSNFSIAILPGRSNLLTLHRFPGGYSHIYGFSVTSAGQVSDSNYLQQRRMELLQRFYVKGQIDGTHALDYANGILKSQPFDPVAACLAAYTKIHLNKTGELEDVPERLAAEYKELPDSHIIYAEYLAAQDKPEITVFKKYSEALVQGIPIFAAGGRYLVQAGKNYGIKSNRLNDIEKKVRNLPQNAVWTSWTAPL